MRVEKENKTAKIPRNFRLKPEINQELVEQGKNFKRGELIGETGIVEIALEEYFLRNSSSSASEIANKAKNSVVRHHIARNKRTAK